jgi:hypothetical protein
VQEQLNSPDFLVDPECTIFIFEPQVIEILLNHCELRLEQSPRYTRLKEGLLERLGTTPSDSQRTEVFEQLLELIEKALISDAAPEP